MSQRFNGKEKKFKRKHFESRFVNVFAKVERKST